MRRIALPALYISIGFVAALMLVPGAYGASDSTFGSVYRSLDVFGDAFERVRSNYVRDVGDDELVSAAISGMVSGLDPHSRYLDPDEFEESQSDTRGEYGGLGLEVAMEDGLVRVVSPIDDSPAQRAGIRSGDFISAIDGIAVASMPFDEAIERMRGPEDSQVTLTILRMGEDAPLEVTLTRAIVRVSSIRYEARDDVGYIRIGTFLNERTAEDLEHAVAALQQEIGPDLKGYVLDLRDDPGGLLDQAIAVVDQFLPGGEIVSIRGRLPQDTQRYNARPGDITDGKPVVVLINEGSASASEIVAGALQDHRRATIIGLTSFGKGSVQTVIPLSGGRGGALWLTTARYYTPAGRSIQALGIVPDIAVSNLSAADQLVRDRFAVTSEADLAGHLDAEGPQRNRDLPVIRPADGVRYDDFQLAYALDRLNGTVVPPPAAQATARGTTTVQ